MAFERFTQNSGRFSVKASIWKGGQIGFSQGAVKHLNLDSYRYAVLYFDPESNRIGIKFTNDEAEQGATQITTRDKAAFVSAKAFMEFYRIKYPSDGKLDINLDEENGLYIIELDK